ncbi:hypothetical protein D7S44_21450 [Pantoea piersonii]|jgi:hypothetical protein|nr:hypothetical protein D7S44_21450 [Pantoea piersonii]
MISVAVQYGASEKIRFISEPEQPDILYQLKELNCLFTKFRNPNPNFCSRTEKIFYSQTALFMTFSPGFTLRALVSFSLLAGIGRFEASAFSFSGALFQIVIQ